MAKLGRTCHECGGVGTVPNSDIDPVPVPCIPCDGTGYEDWGIVDISGLEDKVNDILDKVNDILEKVNE